MNKRKGFLNELIWNHPNDILVDKLLNAILKYYEVDGFVNHISHYEIFYASFCERKKPYWQIAEENFLISIQLENMNAKSMM